MAKTIAITNQKGGVGKTTTAINLGAALAVDGKRVLLIDTDPQANATSGLGIARGSFRWNIYHSLVLEEPVRNAIIQSGFNALSILPSDKNLAGAEIEMVEMERQMTEFATVVQQELARVSSLRGEAVPRNAIVRAVPPRAVRFNVRES